MRSRRICARTSSSRISSRTRTRPSGPDRTVLQPFAEEQRRTVMYRQDGREAPWALGVTTAEQMAARAAAPRPGGGIVQSPNRYDAAVQWHKKQTVLSSVGDDPAGGSRSNLDSNG
jgi:hypothetical protein